MAEDWRGRWCPVSQCREYQSRAYLWSMVGLWELLRALPLLLVLQQVLGLSQPRSRIAGEMR